MAQNYAKRLALGTAQLGMSYGINNKIGLPQEEASLGILELAYAEGIRAIDTASTYGTSQKLLRKFSHKAQAAIYSKFRHSDGYGGFTASVEHALMEMDVPNLAGIWLHDFNDLEKYPELRHEAAQMKAAGKISELGVSVYSNEQVNAASHDADIDCIQMPFNIFDNWHFRGVTIRRAKAAGKKIFIRSAYLQGLLMMDKVPRSLSGLQRPLNATKAAADEQKIPFRDFCLLYPLQFPEIDYVIVGCESETQLRQNLECVKSNSQPSYSVLDTLNIEDRTLLNPITWRV